jgi:hypothetical protein
VKKFETVVSQAQYRKMVEHEADIRPGGERPSEFESALKKLKALFAGALGDAKLESCHAAWSDIKVAKSRKKKFEILHDKARQWREGSVDAVREWFPRFMELAETYDKAPHGDACSWRRTEFGN